MVSIEYLNRLEAQIAQTKDPYPKALPSKYAGTKIAVISALRCNEPSEARLMETLTSEGAYKEAQCRDPRDAQDTQFQYLGRAVRAACEEGKGRLDELVERMKKDFPGIL